MRFFHASALLAVIFLLGRSVDAAPPALTQAGSTIDGASMLGHIGVLASDDFEGRGLAGKGESLTIAYLQSEFARLGLQAGNPDGSWLQKVPLVGVRSVPTMHYEGGAGASVTLHFPQDFVARSWRLTPQVSVADSELVFVGYGVVAPEFKWDDFKGMDLRGKTLVMLINDPPVPDRRHPGRLDPAVFGGDAMTYYGRWTYKYEMAAKLGAAGALIVHEAKEAAYPYSVVRTGATNEGFTIRPEGEGDDPAYPAVHGWLQLDRAKDMFRAAGLDFNKLKAAAGRRDFKPVSLGLRSTIAVDNSWRDVASNNVIAKIDGSDPVLKNEYVIYSAHWDHFGIDPSLPGARTDQIYHGARDNGSGVAALLELAKAYKALPQPPNRSIVFVAPTAEERGLLGSSYYASHPLYPLARTRIDINMDMMNVLGRTRDVQVSGFGKSSTDDWVARVAKLQGRRIRAADAQGGLFFRSDHFSFAKQGVPVLFIEVGTDYIGRPARFGKQRASQFEASVYHKVIDTVDPKWDMRGAVEDTQLLFQVGYDVAQGLYQPAWKEGAEFKGAYDALMRTGAVPQQAQAESGAAR